VVSGEQTPQSLQGDTHPLIFLRILITFAVRIRVFGFWVCVEVLRMRF
jgi:hypothetical protein